MAQVDSSQIRRSSLACIVPPHMFEEMLRNDDQAIRESALDTLLADTRVRGMREAVGMPQIHFGATAGRRSVYDAQSSYDIRRAVLVRSEGDGPVNDESVNRLYDGLGLTRDFLRDVFNRDSIDGIGHPLDGYVHYGRRYNNATFDGRVMRFGDGDGVRFTDFTASLDVIAHELAHGVVQYTANMEYSRQPGALNESVADVIGSLVKQWSLGQTAEEADWLIGADVFTPGIDADALRSMSQPGTAYDNSVFGRDPQPSHMDGYYAGQSDNYGVHINSGIPNKAFHVFAVQTGGNAWETAGHVWYAALEASSRRTDFQEFADQTHRMAGEYGVGVQTDVVDAWDSVGIRISGTRRDRGIRERLPEYAINDRTLAEMSERIESLARQIGVVAKDVQSLKPRTKSARKKR